MKYKNIINYKSDAEAEINFQSVPYDKNNNYKDTNKSNVFADSGSWHGYYLPKSKNLSSFCGPLVLSQEVPINVGPYSNNLVIQFKDKLLNFAKAKQESYSLPGKLILSFEFEELIINKELIFCSNRTALIETTIKNKTNEKINFNLNVEGSFYNKVKTKSTNKLKNDSKHWFNYFNSISNLGKSVVVDFIPVIDKQVKEKLTFQYSEEYKSVKLSQEKNEIKFNCDFGIINIAPNSYFSLTSFESFTFNDEKNECLFLNKKNYMSEHKNRWDKYIKNITNINDKPEHETIVIKSLQTLISNWRSPAGVIKKNFVIPSITYKDFIGAWSWDSWKIAVGVAQFDPKLAQECLEVMFDFQISNNDKLRPNDVGMIPDCIFFNYSPERGGLGENWNERNSKPPIASWAVKEIFDISNDKEFLKRMYPKIINYNKWWNNNRSLKKDNILQYGATIDNKNDELNDKTIIEASAWESGMDNAPRFDWDRVKIQKVFDEKTLVGYVIDQISVDLNSFNYLDLISIRNIAKVLKHRLDFKKYNKHSIQVKKFINEHMYDRTTKFYYDIKANDNRKVIEYGQAMEGIMPLFAKITLKTDAKDIIENINEKNFNQFVPFPSAAVNNTRFSPMDYWRGPVWIDQLYFGVKGISNYGYESFAKELATKAISNMEGLIEDSSIRENYNPLNGNGLSTTNFSWSASLLLLIIKEIVN